jgi:hypothetical protein
LHRGDKKVTEIMSEFAKKWSNMSAQEKAPYEKKNIESQ